MEILTQIIDLFLHLDVHLAQVTQDYGTWTYAFLFLVIFLETGVVVTPFLPGDSLLFAAGAIAALDGSSLNVGLLFALLFAAAVLGDTVNYWIGNKIGPRVFEQNSRFLKREYLERTQAFYAKHGGKTIILARFVPIVRTFAPFVAGVGTMSYGKFITYNIVGGFLWTTLFVFAGYFFGNIEIVKENFELVILGIIFISVLPMVIEWLRGRKKAQAAPTVNG
ncbi:MAG: DedA family protein [Chloroflexi bacterium]|nr:DedA family protein [Chloroflexota bacterium]MBP8054783.1 DedA family protein [Chloroflexota bacterium]